MEKNKKDLTNDECNDEQPCHISDEEKKEIPFHIPEIHEEVDAIRSIN